MTVLIKRVDKIEFLLVFTCVLITSLCCYRMVQRANNLNESITELEMQADQTLRTVERLQAIVENKYTPGLDIYSTGSATIMRGYSDLNFASNRVVNSEQLGGIYIYDQTYTNK